MSTKLEKLTFAIDLLDRVTRPVRGMQQSLEKLSHVSGEAFGQIGTGAAGVAGAGFAMYEFLDPAEQMQRAMGEVASLGVDDSALQQLAAQGLEYSVKYGRAADGFVRSAYDIQSSIDGLSGADLTAFTNAGNVLATGTKASADTITNYMGTMYGIFKDQANEMGKANWVEQLTGRTAAAVQMFKTTGAEMSAAFTSLGANAKAAGIDASEQMAVLGKLQSTMSGSEAGTKYKAFLAGVGNAQKKLGLSFVDNDGNMLGMLEILGKLRGKFGDTFSVAESDKLKAAFGSDEAVSLIKLLMADTDGLASNMEQLGQITGMQKAEEMAGKMVTPFMRMGQGVAAVTTSIGSALMPALNPLIDALANGAAALTRWTQEYPELTKWVGFAVLGILAMTGVLGTLAMVAGFSKVVMIGWTAATTAAGAISKTYAAAMNLMKISTVGFNLALLANPMVWLAGIIIGGIVAVIYYWDDLKATFMDTSWGDTIMKVVKWVLGGLEKLMEPVGWVVDKIGGFLGFDSDESTDIEAPASLHAAKRVSVPAGGVGKQIANTFASNSSKTNSIGQVNVYPQTFGKQELEELLWMGT